MWIALDRNALQADRCEGCLRLQAGVEGTMRVRLVPPIGK